MRLLSVLLLLSLAAVSGRAEDVPSRAPAQPQFASVVQIIVVPDHADWTYQPDDPVQFQVRLTFNRHSATTHKIAYTIGPEALPPVRQGDTTVTGGMLMLEGATMNEPGFLRCIVTTEVEGKTCRAITTEGFAPDRIRSTQSEPADFDRFWADKRAGLAKVLLDARLTPMPDLSSSTVDAFL